MIVKLLTEHHLEFLSLKGGCKGSSEFTLVKMLVISCRGSILMYTDKANEEQFIDRLAMNINFLSNDVTAIRWLMSCHK